MCVYKSTFASSSSLKHSNMPFFTPYSLENLYIAEKSTYLLRLVSRTALHKCHRLSNYYVMACMVEGYEIRRKSVIIPVRPNRSNYYAFKTLEDGFGLHVCSTFAIFMRKITGRIMSESILLQLLLSNNPCCRDV